jgi:hypothetical protein
MSDYDEKLFALVLAAVASGLATPEAIDKATQIMKLLGHKK